MDEWCYAENINWAGSYETLSGEQGKGLMRVKKIHHVHFLVDGIEALNSQNGNFLGLDGFSVKKCHNGGWQGASSYWRTVAGVGATD